MAYLLLLLQGGYKMVYIIDFIKGTIILSVFGREYHAALNKNTLKMCDEIRASWEAAYNA